MTQPLNILIVEDDKVLSLMLQRMVERMGCTVCGVISEGKKAVEVATENTDCDLILMDIMFEDELDGIEAYNQICQRRHIPVIYITGNSDPVNKERAATLGYHDYIIKPVVFDDLFSSISRFSNDS